MSRAAESPDSVQRPIIASARDSFFHARPIETRLVWMGACQAAGLGYRSRGTDHAWRLSFSATRPDNATVDIPAGRVRQRAGETRFSQPVLSASVHGEHRYGDDAAVRSSSLDGFTAHQSRSLRLYRSQEQRTIKIPHSPRRCGCSRRWWASQFFIVVEDSFFSTASIRCSAKYQGFGHCRQDRQSSEK